MGGKPSKGTPSDKRLKSNQSAKSSPTPQSHTPPASHGGAGAMDMVRGKKGKSPKSC